MAYGKYFLLHHESPPQHTQPVSGWRTVGKFHILYNYKQRFKMCQCLLCVHINFQEDTPLLMKSTAHAKLFFKEINQFTSMMDVCLIPLLSSTWRAIKLSLLLDGCNFFLCVRILYISLTDMYYNTIFSEFLIFMCSKFYFMVSGLVHLTRKSLLSVTALRS